MKVRTEVGANTGKLGVAITELKINLEGKSRGGGLGVCTTAGPAARV